LSIGGVLHHPHEALAFLLFVARDSLVRVDGHNPIAIAVGERLDLRPLPVDAVLLSVVRHAVVRGRPYTVTSHDRPSSQGMRLVRGLASNLGLVRPRFVSCQLRSTSVSYTYGVPSSAVHPVGCAACVSGDRARRRRDVSFFGRGQEEFGHSANPSGG